MDLHLGAPVAEAAARRGDGVGRVAEQAAVELRRRDVRDHGARRADRLAVGGAHADGARRRARRPSRPRRPSGTRRRCPRSAATSASARRAPPPRGTGMPPSCTATAITCAMKPDDAVSGPRPVCSTHGASRPWIALRGERVAEPVAAGDEQRCRRTRATPAAAEPAERLAAERAAPVADQSSVPSRPNARSAFGMNSSSSARHAAPSPGAWRSNSAAFASVRAEQERRLAVGEARSPSAARCSGTRARARRGRRRAARAPRRRPRADARPRTRRGGSPGSVISAVRMQPPSQSLRSSTQTRQPARASSAPQASELIPLPTRTTSGRRARAVRRRHRRSRLPASAAPRTGSPRRRARPRLASVSSSTSATATRTVSCEPTIWCPWPSTSSITIRQVDLEPLRRMPEPVSSPASDIVKQPPCAAASSSSGLVLPSGCPIRVAFEYGSSVKAPVRRPRSTRAAGEVPLPDDLGDALDPRHVSPPRPVGGGRAVRVVGLGGRAGRPEDAEQPQLVVARVLEAVDEAAPAGGRTTRARAAPASPSMCRRALALEHVDHLVVAVEVVGRAAGRDEADELRHRRAADARGDAERELPATPSRSARCLVREVDHRVGAPARPARDRGRAPRGARRRLVAPRPPTACPGRRRRPIPGSQRVLAPADASRRPIRPGRRAPRRPPRSMRSRERPGAETRAAAAQTSRSRACVIEETAHVAPCRRQRLRGRVSRVGHAVPHDRIYRTTLGRRATD